MWKQVQEVQGVGFVVLWAFFNGVRCPCNGEHLFMWWSDSSVSCTGKTVCLWGQMSKHKLIFHGVHTWLTKRWKFRTLPPKTTHMKSAICCRGGFGWCIQGPHAFWEKLGIKGNTTEKKLQVLAPFEPVDGTWCWEGKKRHFANPQARSSLSPQWYRSPTSLCGQPCKPSRLM